MEAKKITPLNDDDDATVISQLSPQRVQTVEIRSPRRPSNSAEEQQILARLDSLLDVARRGKASDLFLRVGLPPMFKLNGELFPLRDNTPYDRNLIELIAGCCLTKEAAEKFSTLEDIDTAYINAAGRNRVNIFRQRGEIGACFRIISNTVPNIDDLGMPAVLKTIAEHRRGLILLTGATGSGKSTTLAAIINHILNSRSTHLVTIEDPIEYVFDNKRSVVNQRELGLDTKSFSAALKSALRQAPDVIMVGELRNAETMEVALQAAETGHLVLSTIHTNDTTDAIMRLLSSIGAEKENVVRNQLAENLKAIISQRLINKAEKKGRVAAQEILINTATIRDKILKGVAPTAIREFIAQGSNYGMQTYDQGLFDLYQAGTIDYEEGYNNSTNREDFALRCRGVNAGNEK